MWVKLQHFDERMKGGWTARFSTESSLLRSLMGCCWIYFSLLWWYFDWNCWVERVSMGRHGLLLTIDPLLWSGKKRNSRKNSPEASQMDCKLDSLASRREIFKKFPSSFWCPKNEKIAFGGLRRPVPVLSIPYFQCLCRSPKNLVDLQKVPFYLDYKTGTNCVKTYKLSSFLIFLFSNFL